MLIPSVTEITEEVAVVVEPTPMLITCESTSLGKKTGFGTEIKPLLEETLTDSPAGFAFLGKIIIKVRFSDCSKITLVDKPSNTLVLGVLF